MSDQNRLQSQMTTQRPQPFPHNLPKKKAAPAAPAAPPAPPAKPVEAPKPNK